MRSRIAWFGAKRPHQDELNQMLLDTKFSPLKDKEITFCYGRK